MKCSTKTQNLDIFKKISKFPYFFQFSIENMKFLNNILKISNFFSVSGIRHFSNSTSSCFRRSWLVNSIWPNYVLRSWRYFKRAKIRFNFFELFRARDRKRARGWRYPKSIRGTAQIHTVQRYRKTWYDAVFNRVRVHFCNAQLLGYSRYPNIFFCMW